jgi:single-strand DNA-binding protein
VVWQQGAEYLCQYGHKGDIVGVTGSLITRTWEDKDGNKRKVVEVNCDSVELISSKKSENSSQPDQNQNTSYNQQQSFQPIDIPDANLPF